MARTYVITGSASGVGAAAKTKLESQGHQVIGVDLWDSDVNADLGTPAGRADAVAKALELAPTVDAVIASAGVSAPGPLAIAVNYFGVTEFLEGLRPALAASKAPRAVVVSSMASLHPNSAELVEACLTGEEDTALRLGADLAARGMEHGQLNYPSSKRAISRWVRRESITADWAGAGIALNAVAPGVIRTPMTAELLATPESTEYVDSMVPMPLNYHQEPGVIADLLLWLTSVENSHCAGQTIYCDGGSDAVLRGDDIWS